MSNLDQPKPAPSMVAQREPVTGVVAATQTAPAPNPHAIMESVLLRGDLSKLSQQERNTYYMQTCRSLGLNPLTKPFEYIVLNGKMTLYAKRDACDQLRKVNGISVEVLSRDLDEDGLLTVAVRATDATGRKDEDYGVVNLGALKGEARANAIMKAVTKAKRRVTLSISGLGLLDETEVADIPKSTKDHPWGENGYGNGHSVSEAGEYDPAPGEPSHKQQQALEAAIDDEINPPKTMVDKARAMQDELRACLSIPELDNLAEQIMRRQDYKDLSDTLKDYVLRTQAKTFARLQSKLTHEDAPKTVSERAIAAREQSYDELADILEGRS
jgi:hypothetical protein